MIKLLPPALGSDFFIHNGRLALFHQRKNETHWAMQWADTETQATFTRLIELGDEGEYKSLFDKYLSTKLRILEAGCGLGQVVAILSAKGYQIEGIEYGEDAVRWAHKNYPQLKISVGNVKSLPFEDETFDIYLSFGVLEHFEESPTDSLNEAYRVLKPNGIAMISVPHLNALRKNKFLALKHKASPTLEDKKTTLDFFQYHFSSEDFTTLLNQSGFKVLDSKALFLKYHLLKEHSAFKAFWKSPICRHQVKKWFGRFLDSAPRWFGARYAHMMMYVLKK